MAGTKPKNKALRTLILFIVILLGLGGTFVGSNFFSDATWTPKLAIDLEGGTQLILTPKKTEDKGGAISAEDINQAIEVIRQRVDASGVAEAEIVRNGNENIAVGLPGTPSEETLNLVRSSAVMRFRTVLLSTVGNMTINDDPAATLAQVTGSAAPAGAPAAPQQVQVGEGNNTVTVSPTPVPSETGTTQALQTQTDPNATPAPVTPEVTPQPAVTPTGSATPDLAPAPTAPAAQPSAAIPFDELMKEAEKYPDTPAGASTVVNDPKQITVRDMFIFNHLDCTDPASLKGGSNDDPKKNLVTCDKNGQEKYILGPEVLSGTNVTSASSAMGRNQQGNATGQWEVDLKLDSEGAKKFDEVAKVLHQSKSASPTGGNPDSNRFAIVLDTLVVSAPGVNEPVFNGSASISGSLTRETAATLANQLQFGSLPLNFEVQSEQRISATLGGEHLKVGFYAAIIGLLLVCLYLLWQYHALAGLATASLILAGVITYLVVSILSWAMGYRLSLAGVVGLIVAVGVTMDSFIIYFERIRDEVRDGKPLAIAVETGWKRAKRTIVVSDIVNLVAAIVLYVLAVGGVQGFAFTLGLTTMVDLGIIFLFTHPMMSLLVKTRYFGEGRKFSGLDPVHLGASSNRIYLRSSGTTVNSKAKKKVVASVAAPTVSLARQKAGLPQEDEEVATEEKEETVSEETVEETPTEVTASETVEPEDTTEKAASPAGEEATK
ncbi:MAG: protein translocase subunit SecD [Mobiluncus porci]|uniref:Protein translocase subunit SecD n=1 Tax=Mobiluncus porci TaxID=2652278 RepID=A0A7K0K4M8_9ACTO|nr:MULTISPECIES: protein translocase subunit SecD [Mobiluncus]MCI6584410.1 protein translocase subunit SecD [Mobiluncus sp.]MDD7541830.1 protein translocase subunit SecD [Mobiluncus porci]MDY5748678.1 protein translocase subunit SecD [Mobiluncus porci]MST50427.1 protein translocase subunit SecD [Mobiluncus porci]